MFPRDLTLTLRGIVVCWFIVTAVVSWAFVAVGSFCLFSVGLLHLFLQTVSLITLGFGAWAAYETVVFFKDRSK